MSRLSEIFESVNTSTEKRQQYLADMLSESILYESNLVESKSTMTLHEIETLIAEEAIATGSVKNAEIFLEGINSKIDEGFGAVGSLVKSVYKKVKDFVMSFLTSNVEKAIATFNKTITAEKAKLISEALIMYESKDEDKEAIALISAMKKSSKLNFSPEIDKTPIADKTEVLDSPVFGSLQNFSVVMSHDKAKITIALVSSDKKKNIPMIVLDGTDQNNLHAIIGNKDIKSSIARALITSILHHFNGIINALDSDDIIVLQRIKLKSGETEEIPLKKLNIDGVTQKEEGSEETPPSPTPKEDTSDTDGTAQLITNLITQVKATDKTDVITPILSEFSESDLEGFIEYATDVEVPDNALKMEEIFKDEKNLQKSLEGIKAIIDTGLSNNGVIIAQALVDSKNIIAPKRTGITKPGVRKYSVTRKGATSILNLGDDKDNMTPVFVYNKPAKIIAFYMDSKIFDSIPKSKFLADVLEGFMGIEGEELISEGFQKKFKGATPTATSIKVNFGGMKNIKVDGTGIFTLKNEKLVYKAGNALIDMGAATEEIEAVDGATEIANEVEGNTEEGKKKKKKNAKQSQAMKQFEIVLKKSNFKDNLGALSKSLGISPKETKKHLIEFASKYQGNIPEILSASKLIGGKYAPLTENEFLAYMASLQSILITLSTEFHKKENSKAWLPSMYSKKSYSSFLAAAITAADALNDIVNSDMKPVKDKKPTRKEDSKLKASQYETFAKEYPDIIESLTNAFGGKKTNAKQLMLYVLELDKMKEHINMATLPSVIDTNPKFFNGANIKDKISFVGNLYAENATIDQINGIIEAILYNGVENNFREVEPFRHAIDAIVYVKENGHTPESFKKIESSAFDQSKF
jgi:hypothetical protein